MITGVTQLVTEELEEVHKVVKKNSLSSYMLKPTSLIIQVFKENNKAHENLFKHMNKFWGHSE